MLFVVSAFVVALLLQDNRHGMTMDAVLAGAGRGVLMGVSVLTVNFALGIYSRGTQKNTNQIRAQSVLSFLFFLAIAAAILFFLPLPHPYGNFQIMLALLAMSGALLISRLLMGHGMSFLYAPHRVLVFGAGARANNVGLSLQKHDPSIELVGYVPGPQEKDIVVPKHKILNEKQSLMQVAITHQVDEIVVALSERRSGSMPLRELLDCKLSGVQVVDIATHFEQFLGQIRLDTVSAGWLIFGGGFDQGIIRSIVKWIFDFFGSLILLVLGAPIMVLTALLIFMESKGAILYRQERVGLEGKTFNVIKFRSMYVDAEKDGTPRWASVGDPRITKVGKWIRKTRIDELPQLFSVLKGDMSLVGPRPERPFFVEKLTKEIPFYAARHSVKPGLTGWAQVRYHYGSSVEDTQQKLQYDLYYVKNNSWFMDLVILFETVGVVLTGKGAQ